MSLPETPALNAVRPQLDPPADRAGAWGGVVGRSLQSVASVLNVIGSAWIFGLMCMMLADLGMRFLFNRPISGVAEMAGLSIVGIVYLQLASAVQGGRMVKADFMSQWVARRAPRVGFVLAALFHLLGASTMAVLAKVSLEPFVSAWNDVETIGTAGVFLVVTWPFRGMVLLGSTLAGLCYLYLAVRTIGDAVRGAARS